MRKRLRSTIKWSGAVLTVLLLVVWVGSAWWWCNFLPRSGSFAMAIDRGTLAVKCARPPQVLPEKYLGWQFGRRTASLKLQWWFRYRTGTSFGSKTSEAVIPLWSAALISGLPSLLLWHRDRRRAPGLCIKCGYDLRGNTSAVCPECGSDVPRKSTVES